MITITASEHPWPLWRKVIFRFFFIYIVLHISPWTWLDAIPGVGYVTQYYYSAVNWAVQTSNAHIFHVRQVLVPVNGSGDTSYGWAEVWLFLSLAAVGAAVWSLIDRGRRSYDIADYWLRTFVRYFVASIALSYGIIKIFALQMVFPNLSQLATPLGDFLPMRFSWLFIGYSTPYQVVSGILETLAGLLLLNRRTVTLGLLMASGVFLNVVLLNLSYDIPVKIFSIHMLFYILYLLAYDGKRLATFFVGNKPVGANHLYDAVFPKRWSRNTRIGVKALFIILTLILPIVNTYQGFETYHAVAEPKPIPRGIYDVKTFVLNGDTLPSLPSDSIRWKDVIFDYKNSGSVASTDTTFNQRYRRGYFSYAPDTVKNTIEFKKRKPAGAELSLFTLHYKLTGDNTVILYGKIRKDSVYAELIRTKRHFQLTERQFHWLSEYNR